MCNQQQMPNWCENYLQIIGDDDEVAKFMKENVNEDNELSFAMSCPVPEELEDWDNRWCIENWGTKWDANETIEDDEGTHFNTAWGPPRVWLEKVAEKYSYLQFSLRYAEEGMDFSGLVEYQNGECITDEDDVCGEYFGYKYCHNCQAEIWWEYRDTDWNDEFNMCTNCFGNACKTIKNAVRSKKIEQLPKKLAYKRMGRNPIMDNYLMCKVFIPRLNECVA
jgi:hypothetical protein